MRIRYWCSYVCSSDRALVPIYGTIVTAMIAMLIAIPVSFGIAFFLTEVAPRWLRGPVGTAIELRAGIPSIIYGMWGLFVLVPVMTIGRASCRERVCQYV